MTTLVEARASGLGSRSGRSWSKLGLALSVWDERRRLAEADEATLRDLGLSRDDALREAARSFWDLPAERR